MDQITLENFRCFREKQTARLAPLTLLVGENSTGKTSFMAMIRALWDVAGRERVPDFKEEPYDLGSFDEIAHHRVGSRAETFTAGFGVTRKEGFPLPYGFEVTFEKIGTVPVPVKRHLASEDVWVEDRLKEDGSWQLRIGTPKGIWEDGAGTYLRTRVPEDRTRVPEDYDRLYPFYMLLRRFRIIRENVEEDSKPTALRDAVELTDNDWKLLTRIVTSTRHFHYGYERLYASAPVRSKPRRTYDPARPTRDPEGDYTPTYLASVHFRGGEEWDELKSALEDFGHKSGMFDEISIKRFGKTESTPFQVQVKKYGSWSKGPQRNLIDVGYGVSQVLPVITELLRYDAPPMFLLQQPEVHLHPSAQAALGSLFCQVARPNRQLVVETHSDHLLDRVRMDVRDGTTKLKPEDVSILFFERGDLDVQIHSLRFDKEGNVLDAPPSYRRFFMDETRRSLKL